MRARKWPTSTAVQRGACTSCQAVGCISFPPEQFQGMSAGLVDRKTTEVAAPCQRRQSFFIQACAAAANAGHPMYTSQPPQRVLGESQGWQQLRFFHASTTKDEVLAPLPRGPRRRTSRRFRCLAVLHFPLLLITCLKLLPSLLVTMSSALQLGLSSRPVFPLLHHHPTLGAVRAAGSAEPSSLATRPSVQLAASGVFPLAHINPPSRASSSAQSVAQRFLRLVVAESPPCASASSPALSRSLPVRRLAAAAASRTASSPVPRTVKSPSSAAGVHLTLYWNPDSVIKCARSATAVACTPRCVAHVSLLSLRTFFHERPVSASDAGASDPVVPPTSAPLWGSALASAGLGLSAGGACDGQGSCEGFRRAANHVRLRCAPAASLSLSSLPFLRWTRMPAQKMMGEDEDVTIKASARDGSLSLVKQQLQQQVQEHQAEIRSLLRGLLQMALQCLRSIWGVYFLGLSVLVLPLCASARPYLDLLNRVPLNDPYFLRHLNLPDDASPALFGLPFYEVKVPPLFFPGLSASENRTTSIGRCGGTATFASALPAALQAAAAAQPATITTDPAPVISKDENAPSEAEHGIFAREGFGSDGESPVSNRSNNCSAITGGILRGWLIPAEQQDSRKAIICTHGWLANRQACLPFLNIARKIGLHRAHHIFLFDLKSSGESSSARPRNPRCLMDKPQSCLNKCSRMGLPCAEDQLGCQAAEDLLQAILYMRETCGIKTVSLYAQGVSAMGAMVLLAEYRDKLQQDWGIRIDRVIFDSPVCSACDALQTQPLASCLAKTAAWLYEALIWALTRQRGHQLRRLRASRLLRTGKPYKLLIFSSREDNLAPWTSVRHEMLQLPEQDRPDFIYVFPTGSHCDLARKHHHLLADVIQKFYRNPSFAQSVWEKLTGVRLPVTDPTVETFTPRDLSAAAAAEAADSEQQIQLPRQRLSAAVLSLLHSWSSVKSREEADEEESWIYY